VGGVRPKLGRLRRRVCRNGPRAPCGCAGVAALAPPRVRRRSARSAWSTPTPIPAAWSARPRSVPRPSRCPGADGLPAWPAKLGRFPVTVDASGGPRRAARGRCHARALIAEVLAPIAAPGAPPALVTSAVVGYDEAEAALADPPTKLILVP